MRHAAPALTVAASTPEACASGSAARRPKWLIGPVKPSSAALRAAAAVGLAVALAACGELAPSDTTGGQFVGRTYLSSDVTQAGQPTELVPRTQLSLTFVEGGISASAGCNSMSATGGIRDGVLELENLVITEMACDPDMMAQEQWWAALLLSQPRAEVGDRSLTLTSGDLAVAMVSAETVPDRPLEGTTRQLHTVVQYGTASSVPAGTAATMTVQSDTLTVSVDDCRVTRTPVEVAPSTLRVDPDAFGPSACTDGAAYADEGVSAVFVAGEVPYVIEGDQLRLSGPFGAGLVYRAG